MGLLSTTVYGTLFDNSTERWEAEPANDIASNLSRVRRNCPSSPNSGLARRANAAIPQNSGSQTSTRDKRFGEATRDDLDKPAEPKLSPREPWISLENLGCKYWYLRVYLALDFRRRDQSITWNECLAGGRRATLGSQYYKKVTKRVGHVLFCRAWPG